MKLYAHYFFKHVKGNQFYQLSCPTNLEQFSFRVHRIHCIDVATNPKLLPPFENIFLLFPNHVSQSIKWENETFLLFSSPLFPSCISLDVNENIQTQNKFFLLFLCVENFEVMWHWILSLLPLLFSLFSSSRLWICEFAKTQHSAHICCMAKFFNYFIRRMF